MNSQSIRANAGMVFLKRPLQSPSDTKSIVIYIIEPE
jgi:hypothetical protein